MLQRCILALTAVFLLTAASSRYTPPNPLRTYNVKDYGAVGDGTTDDTAAITSAYNAIPSTGGNLYLPSSAAYKITAGFTINKPITIYGDGSGNEWQNNTLARSVISFSTTTGTAFTNTANGVTFRDIQIVNPNNGTITAGAGISTTTNGTYTRYQNIRIDGFYINLDHQTGNRSIFDHSTFVNPVLYGLKLQDTGTSQGGGDSTISDCFFDADTKTVAAGNAAIAIVGGGGFRFTNIKVNGINGGSPFWQYGFLLNFLSGVQSEDFILVGSSIEGVNHGVYVTAVDNTPQYYNFIIVGNQFEMHADNPTIYFNHPVGGTNNFNQITIESNTTRVFAGTNTNPMCSITNCDGVSIGVANRFTGHTKLCTLSAATTVNLTGIGTLAMQSSGANFPLMLENTDAAQFSGIDMKMAGVDKGNFGIAGANAQFFASVITNDAVFKSISGRVLLGEGSDYQIKLADGTLGDTSNVQILGNGSIFPLIINNSNASGLLGMDLELQGVSKANIGVATANGQYDANSLTNDLILKTGSGNVFITSGATSIAKFSTNGMRVLAGTVDVATGGSTTISTGVGSVRMSTANAATNAVWIPMKYNGTTYYVPGYTTNAP
jgi:hypothetical protein